MGNSPDSGDIFMPAKVYGKAGKEVHRIPYSAQLANSVATWWPMFLGLLPHTSMAVLKVPLPQVIIGDKHAWFTWYTGAWAGWDDTKKALWQGEVCGAVSDPRQQQQWNEMDLDEFRETVLTGPVRGRQPLRVIMLFHVVYSQWAAAHQKMVIWQFSMDPDEKQVTPCPVTANAWGKLIAAAAKDWNFVMPKPRDADGLGKGSNAKRDEAWLMHFKKRRVAQIEPEVPEVEDQLLTMVDGIGFLTPKVISPSTAALRDILPSHRVDNRLVTGLTHVRSSQSLQASVRLTMNKVDRNVLAEMMPQLQGWLEEGCAAAGEVPITMTDRMTFLTEVDALIRDSVGKDWHELGAHLIFSGVDFPLEVELRDITDKRSFKRVIAEIGKHVSTVHLLRAVVVEVKKALPKPAAKVISHEHDSIFEAFWSSPLKEKQSQNPEHSERRQSAPPTLGMGRSERTEPTSESVTEAETAAGFTSRAGAQAVEDGVVVRIAQLAKDVSVAKYRTAIQDVFGVTAALETHHVERCWYHITVPREKVAQLFGSAPSMVFTLKSGTILRARCKDQYGQEYRPYGQRYSSGGTGYRGGQWSGGGQWGAWQGGNTGQWGGGAQATSTGAQGS